MNSWLKKYQKNKKKVGFKNFIECEEKKLQDYKKTLINNIQSEISTLEKKIKDLSLTLDSLKS